MVRGRQRKKEARSYVFYISVLEPGKIELAGFAGEPFTKTKAEGILRGIKGTKSIDNQIQVSQAVSRYP